MWSPQPEEKDLFAQLPGELFDGIFDNLSPVDLVYFMCLSSRYRDLVRSYSDRAFTLSRVLSPYFSKVNIAEFRSLQLRTGCVISGSTALQFFDRTTYESSDLDLYAEYEYCSEIGLFLLGVGYNYTPRENQEAEFQVQLARVAPEAEIPYFNRGICDVFSFRRVDPDSGKERLVQIITTKISVIGVILRFHSTCVMNIITHSAAISLYPYASLHLHRTLKIRETLSSEFQTTSTKRARAKYADRGFQLISDPPFSDAYRSNFDFRVGPRKLDDKYSWVIDLPDSPASHGRFPTNAIRMNSWTLEINSKGQGWMKFSKLESDIMAWRYSLTDDDWTKMSHRIIRIQDCVKCGKLSDNLDDALASDYDGCGSCSEKMDVD